MLFLTWVTTFTLILVFYYDDVLRPSLVLMKYAHIFNQGIVTLLCYVALYKLPI